MLVFDCAGFDWDEGNVEKNWRKHEVTRWECEEVFFNIPLIVADDILHGDNEERFLALGRTNRNRRLFLAFCIRDDLIRVISARDMTKRERSAYEQHT